MLRSWVLTWKDPQRAPLWNPFPAFTDFILSFTVSFLVFPGPELSLVCQPHGADVCIPFSASILPVIIPQTWSSCLSLHVLRIPLGQHDYLPSACCASLTACLAKAKLCPQADISLRTGSSWGKKYHYMEFSPLTTWVSHQIFYSCNRRNLKKSPKPASDQLQTPRDTSSSSLS